MQAGKEYGSATFGVVDICWSFRSSPILQKSSSTPLETPAKDKLFIIVSSDKGLCGGIHSSLVTKVTCRALADLEQADPNSPVMVIGNKLNGQLSHVVGKNMALMFNQIGCDTPTFADATKAADLIMQSSVEYDSISIVYNKFLMAISYKPAIAKVSNEKIPKESRQSMHFPSCSMANHLPAVFRLRNGA